ncbi:hypothetical protein VTN77DRAFT_116 [Rasamsonia byssochlamydoides]|uniref:uncharacterized protein n=1 Tax=Rasamsonia byssochlamydoides TaxID=89139 RepID=UPI0037439E7D
MAALKSQPSITLYRGFPGSGTYVWSPFVTKLEARLRFAGLSYRTEAGSLGQAPRGKIPYIAITRNESEPAALLADSQIISDQLAAEGVLPDLNSKLSPAEKAHDLALRALLEDKLYFYQNHERWNENYYTMRPQVLQALPYPVQLLVGVLAWRKVNATLWGQGTGRFSFEEIHAFKQNIWQNVDALLAEAKRKTKTQEDTTFWVLGGNTPTEADTTLYGFIASALVCSAGPESQKVVRSFPAIIDYARRIHNRYFPDYVSPTWE